jgi:peptide chain release factor 2
MMRMPCSSASTISGGIFDIEGKKTQCAQLQQESADPAFWNDRNRAREVLQKAKQLEDVINAWQEAAQDSADMRELAALAAEEGDTAMLQQLGAQKEAVRKKIEKLEFLRKLSDEDDVRAAILTIHSGAGGTESCDWCAMLFRMYSRWLERKQYPFTILDTIPGDSAGYKSVTMEVDVEYAYGYLKAENGVHRLVRISPFDANSRRHTSFASVYAFPLVEEDDSIELQDKDIRVDTYRASGAGGQHVNKTDSAVRMTHVPTGIVVQCQSERSQMLNRTTALRLLKARVRQHFKEQELQSRNEKLAEKKKIEWGSQIRSYVLHPYNMVKDVRTGVQTSNTQEVLDGDIDRFIESYLLHTE